MLGGDHTTTLSALRSTFDRWGSVSVIHFDSHIGKTPPLQFENIRLYYEKTLGTLRY